MIFHNPTIVVLIDAIITVAVNIGILQIARHHRVLLQSYVYLFYLMRHKYFVYRAGRQVKAPIWRLLVHDWSKFLPSEFGAYRRNYYGIDARESKRGYHRAQLKHIHRNPHHWEHWVKFHYGANGGNITLTPYRMPVPLVREMVADWLGANRAINGEYRLMEWYHGHPSSPAVRQLDPSKTGHKYKMTLHPETRYLVEVLLTEFASPLEGRK